jgi:NTP pyrophosphatase (non-canonical NTP hydrolase)
MGLTSDLTDLLLVEYQTRSAYSDQFRADKEAISQIRYGFFGEVGGLLSAVKKFHRETPLSVSKQEIALEEIGDALWYLAAFTRRIGLDLDKVGELAMRHLQKRLGIENAERSGKGIRFSQIDGLIAFQKDRVTGEFGELLYELAERTSGLFEKFSAMPAELNSATNVELYARLLELLALVAASNGLRLTAVAAANLQKIESRWRPDDAAYLSFFDEADLEHEQLPRELEIEFNERTVNGRSFVVQRWRGVNIGDPLTDNRLEADDYRFHDVFHLAYVAHLGWSPVIRGLLKLKRKSRAAVDENEDGARAMIIEEGIATWIFNHARDKGEFFEGVKEGKLEYALLKQVQSMVAGYEVDKCPLWQWERAILEGFRVFRLLRKDRCGIVKVNMHDHSITYVPRKAQS